MFLIFKQCFAVVKRILSTASREELMCLSVLQSTRKSCIILCMSLVYTAVLNFCDESYAFSCLGKQINVSLVFSVAKWLFTVLMLSHVIIGLWFVKFDGSFNNEFAIEWNISLGRILHSLRGRRKKGRGRGGGRKARKRGTGKGSRRPLPLSPSPSFFFLPPYPLPFSTPATQAAYCIVNNTNSWYTMKCWSCQRITTESNIHNL